MTSNPLRPWLIAARLFALPASSMPVLFGAAAAWAVTGAPLRTAALVVALLGMMILHTGANMLSDVNDWRRGLDRAPTPLSGAIVRGMLTDRQVRRGALLLLALGAALGAGLAWTTGSPALWIVGAAGIFIGYSYTEPPLRLKYRALGDLAVFLNFGVMGALGAWIVQTRAFDVRPMVWALPVALLVIGILHANNWRDIAGDTGAGIRTVASRLGDAGSLRYYGLLVFAPFVLTAAFVFLPRLFAAPAAWRLPHSALLAWMALPAAVRCFRRARRRRAPVRPLDFVALDGATAQLNLLFGLLYTLGVAWGR